MWVVQVVDVHVEDGVLVFVAVGLPLHIAEKQKFVVVSCYGSRKARSFLLARF